jgi:hypothetical protein
MWRPRTIAFVSVTAAAVLGSVLWLNARSDPRRAGSAAEESDRDVADRWQYRASVHRSNENRRELANMQMDLTHLQDELETMRHRAEAQDEDPQQATDASAGSGRDPQPYGYLEPELREEAIVNDLINVVDSESVDEEWSQETETILKEQIARQGSVTIDEMRCASTLCRVVMEHVGEADAEPGAAIDTLLGKPPWNTEGLVHAYSTEPPSTLVIFARQGHRLPQPGELPNAFN